MDNRKHKSPCIEGCCRLRFTVSSAERPPAVDASFWAQARASGEVCGEDDTGHIELTAQNLIPLGVYTVWFITDRGIYPAAPTDAVYTADGADPNRLIVNSEGTLNFYIAPLNFNPFKGIPISGGCAVIQRVAITINTERTTFGLSPGTLGVNAFDQLIAPFCFPRED